MEIVTKNKAKYKRLSEVNFFSKWNHLRESFYILLADMRIFVNRSRYGRRVFNGRRLILDTNVMLLCVFITRR